MNDFVSTEREKNILSFYSKYFALWFDCSAAGLALSAPVPPAQARAGVVGSSWEARPLGLWQGRWGGGRDSSFSVQAPGQEWGGVVPRLPVLATSDLGLPS